MIRLFTILLVLMSYPIEGYANPHGNDQTNNTKNTANHKTSNSEQHPFFIQVIPSDEAKQDADRKAKHEEDKSWLDVTLTGATIILALFTGGLWIATYRLAKDAEKTSNRAEENFIRQANEMRASIAQASRSASAMEDVANITDRNSRLMQEMYAKQMRAYLSVNIHRGMYQDRKNGLKFEINPSLLNSGHTPAHNLKYWATAEILPFPLPDNFEFPVPINKSPNSYVLHPNHGIELNALVNDFVPDGEVEAIKLGTERRVHIWGIVTYDDVFGESHMTKFCHSLFWVKVGDQEVIRGTYSNHHNEAT